MKALVLAGGFGTRLRPLSCSRPKILFPIINKPMLQWTLERLATNDFKEVIMAVFYQTEFYIKHHRVPKQGIRVTYSRDPLRKPLGTGGSIKKAEGKIGHNSPFAVLNGDIFADVNYAEMMKTHEKTGAIGTIALHQVKDPSRYGAVQITRTGRITEFIEKPTSMKNKSSLINAGVYILSPEVFDYIPKGQHVSVEREVFPKLVAEERLYGYVFNGLWMDIGKPADYLKINKIMLDRWPQEPRWPPRNARFSIDKPVALAKDVTIGERSRIGPYAIAGKHVTIGKDAIINNSVILLGASISDGVLIEGAIIGEGAHIGRNARIRKDCIIGDHARVSDNVSLDDGTQICPAEAV